MGNWFSYEDEVFDFEAELKRQTKQQSVEVKLENDDHPDCGPARRHADFPNKLVSVPFSDEDEKERVDTLWSSYLRGVRKYPNNNLVGTRKNDGKGTLGDFVWVTYKDAEKEINEIAAGLLECGLQRGSTVGICSANRAEWTLTALANYSMGLVTVALYDTLGPEAMEYIIDHAETKVALVSKKKLPALLSCLPKCPNLKTVIQFDVDDRYGNVHETVAEADRKKAEEFGVNLIGFSELRNKGRASGRFPDPAKPEDLAFIMYTSGTTGVPKGAMLTHGQMIACITGFIDSTHALKSNDSHLSYLPLAHIYETVVQGALWCHGAAIGFFQGDPKLLVDDIVKLQPTIFAGVPRVFTRMYDKVLSGATAQGGIKLFLFNKALRGESYKVRRGIPLDPNSFYQKKVLSGVRAKLGLTRCRLIVTGAAPCPPYLLEFLKAVVNPEAGFLQGYGMTETAAAVSLTRQDDHTLGHVGPPLPSAEIRLRDVPDMGHLHTNNPPTGEVLARGPSIFSGYYKNDDATKEALTADGWICTGDIGRWNPNGTLSIIDRKKNIFKLAHGEYVAAEKVEAVYQRSPLVGQVFVYGNSYKPFLVAVVVVDAEKTEAYARQQGWWGAEQFKLASPEFRERLKKVVKEHYEDLKKAVVQTMEVEAEKAKLLGFEKVKDVLLEGEVDEMLQGFTVANDCLTPTFKLRRPFLLKRYEQELRALYTKNGEAPKPDEKW